MRRTGGPMEGVQLVEILGFVIERHRTRREARRGDVEFRLTMGNLGLEEVDEELIVAVELLPANRLVRPGLPLRAEGEAGDLMRGVSDCVLG